MHHIADWLQSRNYLAVMNEDLEIVGIVTVQDVIHHPQQQVIDADIFKPHASPSRTIFEVYELTVAAQTHYLPVYHKQIFMGIIALNHIEQK